MKNTQDRLRCRKKGSSTRLPCPLRRSSGNICNFIDVPHLTRVPIMFEPEAPASRVQRQLCTVPATLLWWVRSSCKTHGQMIVCTPSCLWPRVEFLCLLCTKTQLFCFHLPKNPVRHGIIHCRNGMCKEEKYTTGHNKEGSGVSTSRPPELPPNCPLCSVSAIFACGVSLNILSVSSRHRVHSQDS